MNWRTTALMAVMGAWLWLWSWSPLAFEHRFRRRVHEGMTLGQAEAVLGKGEFRKRGITEFRGSPEGDWQVIVVKEDTEFYLWRRGGMEVWLGFLDGRLVHKFFYADPHRSHPPPRAGDICSSPPPQREAGRLDRQLAHQQGNSSSDYDSVAEDGAVGPLDAPSGD